MYFNTRKKGLNKINTIGYSNWDQTGVIYLRNVHFILFVVNVHFSEWIAWVKLFVPAWQLSIAPGVSFNLFWRGGTSGNSFADPVLTCFSTDPVAV